MGQLAFQSTLGGQVNLVGPNTASTFNLNVPAVSSTLATLTGTETLTNKTLTTPTISQFSSASATNLTIQSAGTTAVTIDTSQNVGIGTASPSYKLDVSGTSRITGISTMTATNGFIVNSGASTSAKYIDIENTSGSLFAGVSSSTGTGIMSSGRAYSAALAGAQGIQFSSNNGTTVHMDLDTSGNLLVGGTINSPGARILGQVANGGNCLSITNTSGTAQYNAATFYVNGTTFTNTGAISVSGSTTAYNTSSDYRLKNTIAPMTGALAKVQALKPVTYKWNIDNSDGEGFIAHELAEVCPHAVTGEKDAVNEDGSIKPQGIDTSFLVATLTAAIQELKAINDQQAETLTQQTEAINALTARVVALEAK